MKIKKKRTKKKTTNIILSPHTTGEILKKTKRLYLDTNGSTTSHQNSFKTIDIKNENIITNKDNKNSVNHNFAILKVGKITKNNLNKMNDTICKADTKPSKTNDDCKQALYDYPSKHVNSFAYLKGGNGDTDGTCMIFDGFERCALKNLINEHKTHYMHKKHTTHKDNTTDKKIEDGVPLYLKHKFDSSIIKEHFTNDEHLSSSKLFSTNESDSVIFSKSKLDTILNDSLVDGGQNVYNSDIMKKQFTKHTSNR